jgi:hypothetical protein
MPPILNVFINNSDKTALNLDRFSANLAILNADAICFIVRLDRFMLDF